jgi:aryl-alcohol dehydrogenase-like predicted oxidoreductase
VHFPRFAGQKRGEEIASMNEEKQRITRREFIKASSAVGVGVGLALSNHGVLAEQAEEEEPKLSGPFRLRTLGRTKLEVTELSFGGIQIRDSALLHEAIDRGINLIHTGPGYSRGRGIEIYGEVMKTKRQEVFLGLKETPIGDRVEKDLEKLNTDHVDILVPGIHNVEGISNPELPGAYEKLKKEGKIRFSGFACHSNMADVMRKAIELGFFDVMLVAYNLDNREQLDPILAEAKEKQNMGFMAMKVVKHLTREREEEIPGVLEECIKNKNVDTLLIGTANFDELNTNIAALSVKS